VRRGREETAGSSRCKKRGVRDDKFFAGVKEATKFEEESRSRKKEDER
jgi:hypothetical protein